MSRGPLIRYVLTLDERIAKLHRAALSRSGAWRMSEAGTLQNQPAPDAVLGQAFAAPSHASDESKQRFGHAALEWGAKIAISNDASLVAFAPTRMLSGLRAEARLAGLRHVCVHCGDLTRLGARLLERHPAVCSAITPPGLREIARG